MEALPKLRHRHLVSLLRHCIVTYQDHPIAASTVFIVLENISNASLVDHLTEYFMVIFSQSSHKHEAVWELIGFGAIGTPKLSEFGLEQSQDGNKTVRVERGAQADNILLQQSRSRDVTIDAFWELTAFRARRTPKLSEFELEQSRVPRNKTVRAERGGPKRTISCYGGADPEM
ncbi:hypothetical protein L3X38_000947 [Prunus dulcis]|uniref:Uncharacterized protein n=1 Tax=Prunus dulcis TaxID=3755 RepID=A0AAD4WR41_PRUDU|nr:hypothetical protein L3X38_000947 [Prunus dulcis]